MRFHLATKIALVMSTQAVNQAHSFAPHILRNTQHAAAPMAIISTFNNQKIATTPIISRSFIFGRFFMGGSDNEPVFQNVDRTDMEEIVEDYEEGGRESSGYIILDMREPSEVAATGKVSPNTQNLPLQKLSELNGFELSEEKFEAEFGFPKPDVEETLVFSCAAGGRSVRAAKLAAASGYSKLVNYTGGANEWFSPK